MTTPPDDTKPTPAPRGRKKKPQHEKAWRVVMLRLSDEDYAMLDALQAGQGLKTHAKTMRYGIRRLYELQQLEQAGTSDVSQVRAELARIAEAVNQAEQRLALAAQPKVA